MDKIERISRMEQLLDKTEAVLENLTEALDAWEAVQPELRELTVYYTGPQWRQDYEDDRVGKLPSDLKRGVLSEDAVFDLLTDRRELLDRMRELTEESEYA